MLKFLLTIPYTIFISPPLFFLKLTFSLLRLFLSPLTAFLRLTTLPLRSVSSHTWRAIKFAIEIGGGYRVRHFPAQRPAAAFFKHLKPEKSRFHKKERAMNQITDVFCFPKNRTSTSSSPRRRCSGSWPAVFYSECRITRSSRYGCARVQTPTSTTTESSSTSSPQVRNRAEGAARRRLIGGSGK